LRGHEWSIGAIVVAVVPLVAIAADMPTASVGMAPGRERL